VRSCVDVRSARHAPTFGRDIVVRVAARSTRQPGEKPRLRHRKDLITNKNEQT
jgi:hypothetical protein